jgi:hypothetical protein
MTSILTPPPGGAFFPDTGDQKAYQIGIVGATGAVGIELIRCLYERKFPVAQLRLFASEKSKGKTIFSDYGDLPIEEFSIEECRSCHIVFLAVSGEFALQFASKITMDNGPFVIDNSSAFRYTPDIPLVVNLFITSIILELLFELGSRNKRRRSSTRKQVNCQSELHNSDCCCSFVANSSEISN